MIHSSPLPALVELYDRLPADEVAPYGFSWQKISFRVVLEKDGKLFAIQDARQQSGKRTIPTPLIVPGQAKSPGSGINPGFMWDNAQYMLGYKTDDPKPERTREAFEAFRERHLALRDQIQDEQFAAVCEFLQQWNPANISEVEGGSIIEELASGFGVFQVRGQINDVHEQPAVVEAWNAMLAGGDPDNDDANTGQSLISGRSGPIARLNEPKIKGVIGAQSSGAVIVGFNSDAYESYGKTQGSNAPVLEDEAFKYCTALNQLLTTEDHRLRLGETTVVFWSDRDTPDTEPMSFFLGGGPRDVNLESEKAKVRAKNLETFLDACRRGVPHEGLHDPDAAFYLLGLSPNAARISVRFWLPGTVGEFAQRLAEHIEAIEITGSRDGQPLTVWQMLAATGREAKDIPHPLEASLTRAVVLGTPYPELLFNAIIRRIRGDQTIDHPRAAILKACLIRNYRKEVTMSLNKDHPEPTYHMGRLFSAIEKTQQDSMPGLNRTIKDAYYSSASATPSSVFPKLLRMHQHHIEKLEGGFKTNREKLMQEIASHIDSFPAHLPLQDQGLFALGYYHQRQDFFTPKNKNESETPSEETANV